MPVSHMRYCQLYMCVINITVLLCYFVGDIDANTCKAEWDKLSQDEKDKYGYSLHNCGEFEILTCVILVMRDNYLTLWKTL